MTAVVRSMIFWYTMALKIYDHTEYNTISGLILDVMGHIPSVGEKISWGEFNFEIVDMDSVRIDKVLVNRE